MSDHEQGTQEWKQERCGCVTASRITDVMAKAKSGKGYSASRKNYVAELVVERLTGKPTSDGYESWEMKRGVELEPFARAEYEVSRKTIIHTTGFVQHPTIPLSGASPDGLSGEDGLVQFKAPNRANHLEYLQGRIPPVKYQPQMQFEMACTGRQWCDFVSYHPDFPDDLQLFVVRLMRDQSKIEEIEAEVIAVNREVEDALKALRPTDDLAEKLERSIHIAKSKKAEAELGVTAEDAASVTR